MEKKNLMHVCMVVTMVVMGFNMYWNTEQSFNATKLVSANVEALANPEGGGGSGWKCYSDIRRETESRIDGSGNEKVISKCEYHDCVHGNGYMCTSGSRCVYYHDIYEETVGDISTIFC